MNLDLYKPRVLKHVFNYALKFMDAEILTKIYDCYPTIIDNDYNILKDNGPNLIRWLLITMGKNVSYNSYHIYTSCAIEKLNIMVEKYPEDLNDDIILVIYCNQLYRTNNLEKYKQLIDQGYIHRMDMARILVLMISNDEINYINMIADKYEISHTITDSILLDVCQLEKVDTLKWFVEKFSVPVNRPDILYRLMNCDIWYTYYGPIEWLIELINKECDIYYLHVKTFHDCDTNRPYYRKSIYTRRIDNDPLFDEWYQINGTEFVYLGSYDENVLPYLLPRKKSARSAI